MVGADQCGKNPVYTMYTAKGNDMRMFLLKSLRHFGKFPYMYLQIMLI